MFAASEIEQFSAKEFQKVTPIFTVSRQGTYTIIDITPIFGADGYEVYLKTRRQLKEVCKSEKIY